MRKTPLDDTSTLSVKLMNQTRRDAGILADMLNGAAKPDGYPLTDKSRCVVASDKPKPRRIVKAHAISLAVGYVLDQIDAGELTATDLLKRATMLAELNPTKAAFKRAAHDEVIERARLQRKVDNQ